jgi:aminoglycoside phosphotransferase (APT) family kinase protein
MVAWSSWSRAASGLHDRRVSSTPASNDSPVTDPPGVDVDSVTRWFADNAPQFRPPFSFHALPGGHSNLTYRVTDSEGKQCVLRRGPLGHVLPTAHDMGREFRAIHALGPTPVPVPEAIGFCDDVSVTGAPFYVMGHVAGVVLHDLASTASLPVALRATTSESIFDVLGELHAVDIDAVGLDAHGKRDGYVERQLRRWYQQYTAMKTTEVPSVDAAYEKLINSLPTQQRAAVVHGDFRLGNCITDTTTGKIAAVLDWEISTLGDPMADLGYLVTTWVRNSGQVGNGNEAAAPTLADGFLEIEPLVARYAAASGLDVSDLPWYTAFNHWKGACIIQGVVTRYRGGAKGAEGLDLSVFDRSVVDRSAAALAMLETLG